MNEAVSCGGVVIFRGKILLLFKNYRDRYNGWVLPKGTVEPDEDFKDTAVREVAEETKANAEIVKYIGDSSYEFKTSDGVISKTVHWYLMNADSYYSKPQREEFFTDSGYYKFHEAIYLLKYDNERSILERAYDEYVTMKKEGTWVNRSVNDKK